MEDEELADLNSSCADLLTLKRFEAFAVHLLTGKPGEWVGVRGVCQQLGIDIGDMKADVFAAWLPDPAVDEGYGVIIFYDSESMWTMAAHFNRKRLLEDRAAGTERKVSKIA